MYLLRDPEKVNVLFLDELADLFGIPLLRDRAVLQLPTRHILFAAFLSAAHGCAPRVAAVPTRRVSRIKRHAPAQRRSPYQIAACDLSLHLLRCERGPGDRLDPVVELTAGVGEPTRYTAKPGASVFRRSGLRKFWRHRRRGARSHVLNARARQTHERRKLDDHRVWRLPPDFPPVAAHAALHLRGRFRLGPLTSLSRVRPRLAPLQATLPFSLVARQSSSSRSRPRPRIPPRLPPRAACVVGHAAVLRACSPVENRRGFHETAAGSLTRPSQSAQVLFSGFFISSSSVCTSFSAGVFGAVAAVTEPRCAIFFSKSGIDFKSHFLRGLNTCANRILAEPFSRKIRHLIPKKKTQTSYGNGLLLCCAVGTVQKSTEST